MLKENEVKNYWNIRYQQQDERAVGFWESSIEEQNKRYEIRKTFISTLCPTNLKTLDYGCGIGRYADFFKNDYLGIDMIERAIIIAKKNNPRRKFKLLDTPFITSLDFIPELFFTATVLHHNDDDTVKKIFESLKKLKKENLIIVLYENISTQSPHVCGRTPEKYKTIIEDFYKVEYFDKRTHCLHNEEYGLTLIKV